jgi:hypothetical protein
MVEEMTEERVVFVSVFVRVKFSVFIFVCVYNIKNNNNVIM